MTDKKKLKQALHWIRKERRSLWTDLVEASRTAITPPMPDDAHTWSLHMDWITDSLRSADVILGSPIHWDSLPWDAWPYYRAVTGKDVPSEAWLWLEGYAEKEKLNGHPIESIEWVLSHKPSSS